MNCEQCQEFISLFLDNELNETVSQGVRTHLALCLECAKICEDFAMILDFCALDEAENSVPPNSQALWCRINNILESEAAPAPEIQQQEGIKTNLLARIRNNSWRFSFSQVLTSVLGIALISSLLTVVGFKNYSEQDANVSSAAPSAFERVLGKVGLIETQERARARRVKEQEAAIDYWNTRVQSRRANWDNRLRQAFDRNLNEINQVVFEYDRTLQENPQDELSSEMLDSALNEKMELLREFSDL
ncbi:MAG: zf-HC2 domain-containing protein [Acidobacteria bacterium]|nr:zf-HC2 domain-containing protein [Acidobacteriota bacterium]